jgi:hypothetical protein
MTNQVIALDLRRRVGEINTRLITFSTEPEDKVAEQVVRLYPAPWRVANAAQLPLSGDYFYFRCLPTGDFLRISISGESEWLSPDQGWRPTAADGGGDTDIFTMALSNRFEAVSDSQLPAEA